jgi:hypothetical protein
VRFREAKRVRSYRITNEGLLERWVGKRENEASELEQLVIFFETMPKPWLSWNDIV